MIKKIFIYLISIPKSLVVNLIIFGIKGIKIPVLIAYNTKILEIHFGTIEIENNKFMTVKYGFGGSKGVIKKGNSELCLEKKSKLIFKGQAHFADGISIRNSGCLIVGNNFSINKNGFISCYSKIDIGNDVLIGWDVNIRDSDGHYILKNGQKGELSKIVVIGNHVWICSYSHILKGVLIGDNSVVAYRSLLIGKEYKNNRLIAGSPAKEIKENIDWEY